MECLEQALSLSREIGDQNGEAATLHNLGALYRDLGEKQKALEYYQQVLQIRQKNGDRRNEAADLDNIAKIHGALGDRQKALEYFEQALSIRREIADRSGEATTLSSMAVVYRDLGEKQKALECYQQVLSLRREIGDQNGEAATLKSLGFLYSEMGDRQQCLENYQRALLKRREMGDRRGEAAILNSIGGVYGVIGQRQKALEHLQQALSLTREGGDRLSEATVLNGLAILYRDLGDRQRSLEYFRQALSLTHEDGDRLGEATVLDGLGILYRDLGQKKPALESLEQALSLSRQAGNRRGEQATFNAMGMLYSNLGEPQKALEYYNQSLLIARQVGLQGAESAVLNNLGSVYSSLGENQKALEHFVEALPIERRVQNRGGEAITLGWISKAWTDLHNPALAIFFGKQSVNMYQSLRRDIQGLDKDTQKTYLDSITAKYRALAHVLLAEGRLPEAEQVLGMLKEQEFKEFTRGGTALSASAIAPLTSREQAAENILSQGLQWRELGQLSNRTPEQQVRYAELSKALTANNVNLANFWQALQTALPARQAHEAKVESSAAQKLLHRLPAGTAIVYTLILDDELDLIVVGPEAMVQKSVPVKRVALAATVEQFRSAIRDHKVGDALLGPAQKLHSWLVTPIAAELENVHATTIAWSLDSVLRYIPINALYDGRQFLIERYTNVTYTPADTAGLEDEPAVGQWKALGLGVSKLYLNDLSPLPSVPGELRTIVRDSQDQNSHGPLPGHILLDDAFTEQAMEQQLQQNFPLVHIASHFVMGLTTDDSYLLLGGEKQGGSGYRLRLSDIETMKGLTFDSVALLSLSACETAMSKGDADGKEVDSLAAIGRQRGAQAVLATLWDVNDASTGQLMADFYRRWTSVKGISKSESLRQAQLELLHSSTSPQSAGAETKEAGRGVVTADTQGGLRAGAARYSHPYYWAPFILMGNWR